MTIKPKRQYLITLFILLMVSSIFILNLSLLQEQQEAHLDEEVYTMVEPLPLEAGVFARSESALAYHNMPDDPQHQRSLVDYYRTRAYVGAPPVIPHIVLNEKGIGEQACLQCHQNGGFVAQFNAYAPVTPHPELLNCKQCHVPVKTNAVFRESNFDDIATPKVQKRALLGSPPVIPHTLQMRGNCLACHAGPSVPKEIRVTHPERINCRQCHAVKPVLDLEWVRETSGARR